MLVRVYRQFDIGGTHTESERPETDERPLILRVLATFCASWLFSIYDHRVSLWRCKCGVNVKVATETDRTTINERFKLEVACPNCGDKQLVYAHRVVQGTTERPDGLCSDSPA